MGGAIFQSSQAGRAKIWKVAMNPKHEANRRRWNAASASYSTMGDRLGNWRKVVKEPGWAFLPEELALLGDVTGQRAAGGDAAQRRAARRARLIFLFFKERSEEAV